MNNKVLTIFHSIRWLQNTRLKLLRCQVESTREQLECSYEQNESLSALTMLRCMRLCEILNCR